MIKLDDAYKFGAGRYIQGSGTLEKAGNEILRFGKKAFIFGGPTAISITKERLEKGFQETELQYIFEVYDGNCTYETGKLFATKAIELGCDVIVGVGGGRIMDLSKLCGYYGKLPVVNIPTSIATCAAYTPLSVVYTTEGASLGSLRYENEVSAVLVDMDIIVNEPPRYVSSGILDAMAKKIEIQNGYPDVDLDSFKVDLVTSYSLACYTYDVLLKLCDQACKDVAEHKLTKVVEDVTFLTIAVTGMISGISKGFGQSAIGHEFYERTRTYFTKEAMDYLHGEIVAVGLLAQLHYNKTPELVETFRNMMKGMGMPASLADINVPPTNDTITTYYNGILESPFVPHNLENMNRLKESLNCLL
jgi:glycerol dehydrogenase-like iron-containing ADH family enzyme